MWPLTYSDPGGTAEHLSTSATSTALAPQVPGSTALVPLSTAQRLRGAVHCYFNTHRHTALLCMYCSADIAGKGRHGWVVRWSGAAVQTNFSVDDLPGKGVQCACHMQGKHQGLKCVWTNTFCNVPKYFLQFGQILFSWWPGKGVQCACHMQGKQQSRNQKSSLFHIVRCRQVPCNYKLLHCNTSLHCYTALHYSATVHCACHCWNILSSQFSSWPTFRGGGTCWWEANIKRVAMNRIYLALILFLPFFICSR